MQPIKQVTYGLNWINLRCQILTYGANVSTYFLPPGHENEKFRGWFRGELFKFPRRRRLFQRRMCLFPKRWVMFLRRRRLFVQRKHLFPRNMCVFPRRSPISTEKLRICTEKRWPLWSTVQSWLQTSFTGWLALGCYCFHIWHYIVYVCEISEAKEW